MLIMRKHRNAKWDRKSRKCTKETVGDSYKFSRPFVLLTENVIHELKLHCQIRSGPGHGGTFHCNEMQRHLEPDVGGVGVCTLTGAMSCQLAPVLAVPGCLTPTSSMVEAFFVPFLHAFSSSKGQFLLSHICSSKGELPRETWFPWASPLP